MKKTFWIMVTCFTTLFVVACQAGNIEQPSEPVSVPMNDAAIQQESTRDPFHFAEEIRVDFDLDGIVETVQLYEKSENNFHIRVETHDQSQVIPIPHAAYAEFDRVISLGDQRQAILMTANRYQREDTIEYPIDQSYEYIIIGMLNDQLSVLLDTSQLPIQNEDNYEITYEGSEVFNILDSSTGFEVTFKADVVEEYRKMFDLSVKDEASIRSSYSSTSWFNSIRVDDFDKDRQDEITLTKMITGYYRHFPLGFFEYTYRWENGEYVLQKESFYTASGVFMLEPTVIKEMDFIKN